MSRLYLHCLFPYDENFIKLNEIHLSLLTYAFDVSKARFLTEIFPRPAVPTDVL